MGDESFSQRLASADRQRGLKMGFMDITSATNSRTFIACVLPPFPCGNKVPTLSIKDGGISKLLLLSAYCNSFACDFATRTRLSGLSMNWFIVEELPIPSIAPQGVADRVALAVARLTFLHRRFAPEWLQLRRLYPELAGREWKHQWAVTEADRLRLRIEIDALCAEMYGLTPDDFDWIVRDDPTDPKGFYRVDRNLAFRERLTGLAAAAFRALKAGKWSAESAGGMSNDEFFAAIGIPEMTNPEAARRADKTTCPEGKPLILKREGCHHWKPEEFGPDDPRKGWTWTDCHKDAVTLLGSEDAVRKYVGPSSQVVENTRPSPSHRPQPGLFDPEAEVDFAKSDDSGAAAAFFHEVAELDRGGHYDRALDLLFTRFDASYRSGDFSFVDAVLRVTKVADLSHDTLIGFLTATLPAKNRLDQRSAIYKRVLDLLSQSHTPREVQRILKGLE
jgi:hypothetical protein